jgi:hypothetical protein
MKRRPVLVSLLLLSILDSAFSAARGAAQERVMATPERAFEMRIYTAAEGKLEDLHRRFREHTIGLFEKHGMTVVAFWTPTDEERAENTLIYILAYPSAEARETSWRGFIDDPEWKRVYAESHRDGPLVAKVESTMMTPTDYSPIK